MCKFIIKLLLQCKKILGILFDWIFSHKRISFIYVPSALAVISTMYVLIIFFSWQNDRNDALKKLAEFKKLIDRTEELQSGSSYSTAEIDLSEKAVNISTKIYDRNNEIIGEFFEQKREIVPYDFIPGFLVKAVIASEDRDFYRHRGISYRGIFRAFLTNLIHLRIIQGGSTITQQLAKVLFTDMERNMKRKIYETFCAREIEKTYDKQDIMSMYLNLIYFGNGAYGVEAISRMFFNKPVKECNEVECAMIVATISNPKIYSPLSNQNNAVKKTKKILDSMINAGFINKNRVRYLFDRFLKKWDVAFDKNGNAVSSLIGSFTYSTFRVNRAPFFNENIRRILTDKFGEEVLKKGGLKIYTTIHGQYQDLAEECLKKGIAEQRMYLKKIGAIKKTGTSSATEMEKVENIEGALVTLDPGTGEILAYVGGSEFSSANQNDNVSQIFRQPGSSFKPIVYAAAIESRDLTPSTVFIDEPTVFDGNYSPKNYDGSYSGKVTVRNALKKSVNIVAVKVLDKTGYNKIFDILRTGLSLPYSDLNDRFKRTLSLALGTYEVSPLENCVLHATIVNGGEYVFPYGIRNVKDYYGNIVWNNEEEVQKNVVERRKEYGKIIDPSACAVTVSMLQSVFEPGGTAHYAVAGRNMRFQKAGKTGTSANFVDAWFIGYTSNSVTAVWMGNKTGAISLGAGRAGGAVVAPVWAEYASRIFRDNPPPDFSFPPDGTAVENICQESGKVARGDGVCPATAVQRYLSGTEPGELCDIHVISGRESRGEDAGKKNEK